MSRDAGTTDRTSELEQIGLYLYDRQGWYTLGPPTQHFLVVDYDTQLINKRSMQSFLIRILLNLLYASLNA